jgi:sterol 3beta-glucosyltransferase
MRISLTSGGSRGDAQPYIALARGFLRAGHDVRVVTTPDFASLVEGEGFDVRYVDVNIRSLLESGPGRELLAAGANPLKFLSSLRTLLEPVIGPMLLDARKNFEGSDAMIAPSSAAMFGTGAFEWLGIPFCVALMQPLFRTREFAHPFFPPYPRGVPGRDIYNRLTFAVADAGVAAFAAPAIGHALRQRRIRPAYFPREWKTGRPLLLGYSSHVVPRAADWPAVVTATGFWFLEHASSWKPPHGLVDFLNAGPQPVSIGFGSMNNKDPAAATRLAVDSLKIAGRRGVLLSGWGGLGTIELPDFVYMIESAPHDWLFPRMVAVVHHCGAGTTGAGLAAGVPAVPVPFFADQLFWARRLHELGVAPKPIIRKNLTAENLAQAIIAATSDVDMRKKAEELGRKIRAEDGVGNAVKAAEEYFEKLPKKR